MKTYRVAKPEGFRLLAGEGEMTCKRCGVRCFGVGNDTPIGKMYL